ncbi:MAG: hypothetical protein AAF686_06710 [Pseudomonadota bacterium]
MSRLRQDVETKEIGEPMRLVQLTPFCATSAIALAFVAFTHAASADVAVVSSEPQPLQRATRDTVGPHVRIAPRRVVEQQLAAKDGVFVPHGYEKIWDDDRLSLTRAHQTYSGQDQMGLIWNDRLPRGLLDR